MERRLDKLEIAAEILEAAICEFLDSQRFAAALHLAGAAEEILGKYAKSQGLGHHIADVSNLANVLAAQSGIDSVPGSVWYRCATHYKNAIKHLDSEDDRFVMVAMEDEARDMIGGALSNYSRLELPLTPTIARFYEFAREWSLRQVE